MSDVKEKVQFRQGDVFIIAVDDIPSTAKEEKVTGRIVLQYGEVTGHAHAIYETKNTQVFVDGVAKFLKIAVDALLKHEEHATVVIPPGTYEVRRQIEWDALKGLARAVID